MLEYIDYKISKCKNEDRIKAFEKAKYILTCCQKYNYGYNTTQEELNKIKYPINKYTYSPRREDIYLEVRLKVKSKLSEYKHEFR